MKLFNHTIKIQKLRLAVFLFITIGIIVVVSFKHEVTLTTPSPRFWDIQVVDTMKYSRDVSREKLNDPTFDIEINRQVADIAGTGATHVAIATPYDEEFLPILKRWIKAARKHNLHVWFRGNFSGWEKWFDYPAITRSQHLEMTKNFIISHPDLFEDGDIFSACPECENGGPGDPRLNGDATGHKKFLIDSYATSKEAFKEIKKQVASNFMSMNGDVAKLIMDPETTAALDGLVTIDHYVATPEKLLADVEAYAKNSKGQVFLGEYGVPIPDINGEMTQVQQAQWITTAGKLMATSPHVYGMSYWVNRGGSTAIWDDRGKPKKAVEALKSVYSPQYVTLKVVNEAGEAIQNSVADGTLTVISGKDGFIYYPYVTKNQDLTISANSYRSKKINLNSLNSGNTVVLTKVNESFMFKLKKLIHGSLPFISSPVHLN